MNAIRFALLTLSLLGILASAHAQTAPASSGQKQGKTATPTRQANRKARKYDSPVVVENTEALGKKIQQVSRPADQLMKGKPLPKK